MSFLKNLDFRFIMRNLFILLSALLVFYLKYNNIIQNLLSTLLFIILGTLLVIFNIPGKYDGLFRAMNTDNLTKFIEFLSKQGLKASNIHKIQYMFGKTPIIIAMERDAYNIFKYLIENNYDLSYAPETKNSNSPADIISEPVITFAATHPAINVKYLELLVLHKDKFDINAKSKKFDANALELAVWRESEDKVEALLNAGMKFSIQNYNNTKVGKLFNFEKISLNIKKVLLKRIVFNKNIKQLNMANEFSENNLKSFKKNKIYWKEYLKFIYNNKE